ncbi:MAG: DUF748 domain-containing protein [Pseudobdellovibrio sp.]
MKKIIIILLIICVVIRIVLPFAALNVLNNLLEKKMGVYRGHVEDLDLSLYRGAYQLLGFEIKKRNTEETPLLFIKQIDLSIAWRALLQKHLTMDITIDAGTVHLSDSKDKSKKQFGNEESKESWSAVFDTIIPISIETLIVHNSSVYFTNHDQKLVLPVKLERIELQAHDLRTHSKDQLSPFDFSATLQSHAPLHVSGRLDILKDWPEGEAHIEMEKFEISSINSVLRYYIPLDITHGEASIYSEIASEPHNTVHGYFKLFLANTDVIAPNQKYLSWKHFFIEVGTAVGNWALKNAKTHNVAVRLPFRYENGKLDLDPWKGFWSAVSNSNTAIKPGLEHSVTYHSKNLSSAN